MYEQDGLLQNAVKVGAYLGKRLEEIKTKYRCVGDVRYIGLFTAIEIVNDKRTKKPIDPLLETGKFLRDNGLYTFIFHNVIFVVPPLCIDESQLDEGLLIVEKALDQIDKSMV